MAQGDTSSEMEDFEGEDVLERMRVKERRELEILQERRTRCVFPECQRPVVKGTAGCRIHVMAPMKRPRSLCRAGRCIGKPLPGIMFCSDHQDLQDILDNVLVDLIEAGARWVATDPWGIALYQPACDACGAAGGTCHCEVDRQVFAVQHPTDLMGVDIAEERGV
jgi:hypothetical protein